MAKKSRAAFKTGHSSGHKHIKQEDGFTRATQKVIDYFRKSPWQAVLTTVAVVGIIVFGSIFISRLIKGRDKTPPAEASISLKVAQELFFTNVTMAEDSLRALIAKFPNTIPGEKALYYLGQALFIQSRYEEAIEQYAAFERKYSVKNSVFKPLAYLGQGNCLENMGRYEEALNHYLDFGEKYPDAGNIPEALLAAGRCMIELNQLDRAEELFEEMAGEYTKEESPILFAKILGELGRIEGLRYKF